MVASMGEKVVKIQGYQHGRVERRWLRYMVTRMGEWREGGEDTGLRAWEKGRKGGEDTGLPAWESGREVLKILNYHRRGVGNTELLS